MKTTEVMKRAKFFRLGRKMILKFDLSDLDGIEEVKRVSGYFKSMVGNMPVKSTLGLVDFAGLSVSEDVKKAMIELAEFCNPHFRASAIIVKNQATKRFAEDIVNHFGNVNIPVYEDEETAKEWLFAQ